MNELRDIKPLLEVPLGPPWWVWALAATLVALLLGALLWWWRSRRRPAQAVVAPDPADVVALRALAELSGRDLSEQAGRHRYCVELSQIVRSYIEARFGLNATDLTTEEIARAMAARPELSGVEQRVLEVLRTTDGVKFAQQATGAEALLSARDSATAFVEATRPRELAAPAA